MSEKTCESQQLREKTCDGEKPVSMTYRGDWIPFQETALAMNGEQSPLYHKTVAHDHKKQSGGKSVGNGGWKEMTIPTVFYGMMYKCSCCGKEYEAKDKKN